MAVRLPIHVVLILGIFVLAGIFLAVHAGVRINPLLHHKASRTAPPTKEPLPGLFEPGTLQMPRMEALQLCNVTRVARPLIGLCGLSRDHRWAIFTMPKVGSSWARALMAVENATMLKGGDCDQLFFDRTDVVKLMFVRDPMSKLLSGLEEFARRFEPIGPLRKKQPPRPSMVPAWAAARFLHEIEQLGKLQNSWEGMPPMQTLVPELMLQWKKVALEHILRVIVRDPEFPTDAKHSPFADVHIVPQVAWLIDPNGSSMMKLTRIIELGHQTPEDDLFLRRLSHSFKDFSRSSQRVRHARARPPGMLVAADISLSVLQDACRFLAQDYCCLNFRLPTECAHIVQCQLRGGKITAVVDGELREAIFAGPGTH